ncbi:unnamed protein product [Clavelina lepadiformis]|uniref:Uncharacterized protein n=1 Tax=Clavelina lepadiformis TaxID=159417 RepID=A0ABP0F3Z7_CLALP
MDQEFLQSFCLSMQRYDYAGSEYCLILFCRSKLLSWSTSLSGCIVMTCNYVIGGYIDYFIDLTLRSYRSNSFQTSSSFRTKQTNTCTCTYYYFRVTDLATKFLHKLKNNAD